MHWVLWDKTLVHVFEKWLLQNWSNKDIVDWQKTFCHAFHKVFRNLETFKIAVYFRTNTFWFFFEVKTIKKIEEKYELYMKELASNENCFFANSNNKHCHKAGSSSVRFWSLRVKSIFPPSNLAIPSITGTNIWQPFQKFYILVLSWLRIKFDTKILLSILRNKYESQTTNAVNIDALPMLLLISLIFLCSLEARNRKRERTKNMWMRTD